MTGRPRAFTGVLLDEIPIPILIPIPIPIPIPRVYIHDGRPWTAIAAARRMERRRPAGGPPASRRPPGRFPRAPTPTTGNDVCPGAAHP